MKRYLRVEEEMDAEAAEAHVAIRKSWMSGERGTVRGGAGY